MSKKSLVKNSIFNVVYKGFSALFPLVTTTYISRVLLPEGVGRVAYANTIAAYFVLLASLGLPSYGVKAVAQSNQTKEQRSKTFFELFIINFVATVCCTVAYFTFVDNFAYFADRRPLFRVMGLMLVLNVFSIDWFYQGMEEYSYIATRSLIVKILSFVAMFLFVKQESDYLIYALILCIATAGNNILNAIQLRKYICIPKEKLHMGIHLRPVFVLLMSTVATEVYTMLDTVMLEYFHGEIYVGYYSNAVKIVRMVYSVVIAMIAVFYPRISMYYKNKDYEACNGMLTKGIEIMLLLAVPCTVGLAATAEYIIPLLFKNAFLPAVGTLRILSVLVLVFSVAYFLGHIILTATGMEKMILRATVLGAVVNAVSNVLLIPRFQHNGAAVASVLSEIVVTVVLLWHSKQFFTLHISRRYIESLILSTLIMVAVVFGLKYAVGGEPWFVLMIIAAAALVYGAGLFLLKNDIVLELLQKIRR